MMTTVVSLWLAAGCGGETNLCAEAAAHLEQCAGISIAVPETCSARKASVLLEIPCDALANDRSSFSASWSGGLGAWFSDPEDSDPWAFFGNGTYGDVAFGWIIPPHNDIYNRSDPNQDPVSPWVWHLYMDWELDHM
jgi:hypothetical protein